MIERLNIGSTLRDLRRQHNMTGGELAKKVGISQSRISNIETGALTKLKPEEIAKILDILEASVTIRQQVSAALGEATPVHLRRYKTRFAYADMLEQERKTQSVKAYSVNVVPALLQTAGYRRAFLSRNDMSAEAFRSAMQTGVKRQDLLWEKGRRYHFILHESTLYTLVGDRRTHFAQLDRLDRLAGQRELKIGIIPSQAGFVPADNGSFFLHDDRRLFVSMATADILITDPDDVNTHRTIFAELDKLADYGDSALAVIRKALDYFS